jgi:hypothetical protein
VLGCTAAHAHVQQPVILLRGGCQDTTWPAAAATAYAPEHCYYCCWQQQQRQCRYCSLCSAPEKALLQSGRRAVAAAQTGQHAALAPECACCPIYCHSNGDGIPPVTQSCRLLKQHHAPTQQYHC